MRRGLARRAAFRHAKVTERFAGIETLVLALPLAGVIGLLSSAVQNRPRFLLHAKPRAVWAVPFLSAALLACTAALAGGSASG